MPKKKVSRPGRPKSKSGPLPSRSMKVSDAEWKAWKRAAKASGKPLNRWIRDICNMAAAAERAFSRAAN